MKPSTSGPHRELGLAEQAGRSLPVHLPLPSSLLRCWCCCCWGFLFDWLLAAAAPVPPSILRRLRRLHLPRRWWFQTATETCPRGVKLGHLMMKLCLSRLALSSLHAWIMTKCVYFTEKTGKTHRKLWSTVRDIEPKAMTLHSVYNVLLYCTSTAQSF